MAAVNSPREDGVRAARNQALIACAVAIGTAVILMSLTSAQGNQAINAYTLPLLIGSGFALAGAATASRKLIFAGALTLTLLGMIALFSVGLPLLIAGGMLWSSFTRLGFVNR
ncbi:MAG: hypothetical protein ACRDZ3_08705 [Acidimicrobiia bacterium]